MLKKSFVLILLCLLSITAYAGVKDGLYLHLPLNEGSGTPKDVSNNKFKTEMSKAAPKWVDGGHAKVKKALEFDGKTNSVKIDMEGQKKDINSHYDPAKGLSICAWVKVIKTATDKHGQTRQPIVMKGAGGQWEFALLVYDDLKAGISYGLVQVAEFQNLAEENLEKGGTFNAEHSSSRKVLKFILTLPKNL